MLASDWVLPSDCILVGWVYRDSNGMWRILNGLIPPGCLVPLVCAEGAQIEPGMDAIARRYARSGRVRAAKFRFSQAPEALEVVDGTEVAGEADPAG
jgi:hypothetical protein